MFYEKYLPVHNVIVLNSYKQHHGKSMKYSCLFTVISVNYYSLVHGLSNCSICAIIGKLTILVWYTDLKKTKYIQGWKINKT